MSTELLVQKPVFNPGEFAEPEELTDPIWEKLSAASHYFFRLRCEQEAPAILAPIVALAERSGVSSCRTKKSIAVILRWMVRRRETFWRWDQATWKALLSADLDSRLYVAAVAYHFGRLREPVMFANAGIYAEVIFGSAVFHQELDRLRSVLQSLGYAQAPLHAVLPSLLGHLMLENGDPKPETFTSDLLVRGQAHRVEGVARGSGKSLTVWRLLGSSKSPYTCGTTGAGTTRTHQGSIPSGLYGAGAGVKRQPNVQRLVKATIA